MQHSLPRRTGASSVRNWLDGRGTRSAVLLCGTMAFVLVSLPASSATDSDNVLLDFTATWCGPCQQMSSTVSKLERQGYPIRKVDVDKEPSLASRFNVQSIPCFVLVANGKEIDRVTGLTTEQQLRGMLNRLPKPAADVAAATVAPRRGNSSANGGNSPNSSLGLPESLGSTSHPDGKRPLVTLPPLFPKNKSKSTPRDETAEAPVARAQSPTDASADKELSNDPLVASVRLRVHDDSGVNFGSGTIIESQPGRATILTCGHIFRKMGNDSKVEVDLFGSSSRSRPDPVVGKVLHYDLDADVGVITIAYPQRLPVARLGFSRGEPALQDKVFSIGCGGGEKPSREELTLTAINKYAGPDNLECTGMPQQGRSGGGLFRGTDLVGVCIAADPKEQRGIYAGLKPVAQLLDKVGMGHLVPQPSAPPTASLATNTAGEKKAAALGDPASIGKSRTPTTDNLGQFLAGELGAAGLNGAPAAPQDYAGAEIICIVRPKTPGAPSRVVIVNQASERFVGDLLHESNGTGDRHTAQRADVAPAIGRQLAASEKLAVSKSQAGPTSSRPIETSFEPQPYRRRRGE